jgi:amino acid transporter
METEPNDRTEFHIPDRRLARYARGEKYKLTAVGGIAAFSLDALSSVAYGPEAIVLALIPAGVGALHWTVPVAVAITVLLLVLVVSYRQVIAVHPTGGGAYAVAKADLTRPVALLAAASLVVDYVLTVAVSLAAGAASLASVFPMLAPHLLELTLAGLAALTAVNLIGISESAKVLMWPTLVFIVCMVATIVVGVFRPHPVAMIGTDLGPVHPVESIGILLVLKAFAAGCSALTGVEAIANGVPAFRAPGIKRAQHTEVGLGVLLAVMLLGIAALIQLHRVVPRGGVTILAQLTAASFGTGWEFYATNIAVTVVLAFAANTSFGGLPVLLSLLAKDNRLPHMMATRSERPVYRYGVAALAIIATLVLVVVGADTKRLLPVYAIGVFIGFTISQTGLVKHWFTERPAGWRPKALINGFGAVLSAVAGIVFFSEKFAEGAWLLLVIVPTLIGVFMLIERYYRRIAIAVGAGLIPAAPALESSTDSVVVVPIVAVSKLARLALERASQLGGTVIPIAVDIDAEATRVLSRTWEEWDPGFELTVLPSPHRQLINPTVGFIGKLTEEGRNVTVLLMVTEPRHRILRLMHNPRGPVFAAALKERTSATVATVLVRLEV